MATENDQTLRMSDEKISAVFQVMYEVFGLKTWPKLSYYQRNLDERHPQYKWQVEVWVHTAHVLSSYESSLAAAVLDSVRRVASLHTRCHPDDFQRFMTQVTPHLPEGFTW